MKKLMMLLSMLCLLALGSFSASAMDSATLLQNPDRYRVISTEPDGIVYVDMKTISGMQTMDYPNSIENISAKLYVEKYNSTIDAMTFMKDQTIRQINEYDAVFHANKREGTYDLGTKLVNVYKPTGEPYAVKLDTVQWGNIKDMFISMNRLTKLQGQLVTQDTAK